MNRIRDLAGQVFGRLTVLHRAQERRHGGWCWVCLCSCGTQKTIPSGCLTSGSVKSCGCLRVEHGRNTIRTLPPRIPPLRKNHDITGQKFGRWTVISLVSKGTVSKTRWFCRCDCGTERTIIYHGLFYGLSKSCGCLQVESARRLGVARIGRPRLALRRRDQARWKLFRVYKDTSKKRGYDFTITYEQFSELTALNCNYCGREPSQVYKAYGRVQFPGESYLHNGIDRVENSVGYLYENCVPCCRACNVAKARMSESEFLDLVERIYSHRIVRRRLSVVAS